MSDDPLEEIEAKALRERAEELAQKSFSRTRAKMLLNIHANPGKAFWSYLAMNLEPKIDWEIQTACTDGRELRYNPEFWAELTEDERAGVLVHECAHCALKHFARLGTREMRRANIAMDLAINPLLVASGYKLPKGCLFPKAFKLPEDYAWEKYYDLLPPQEKEGCGPGGDPGGCGGVAKPKGGNGGSAGQKHIEQDWDRHIATARQLSTKHGKLPGALEKWVGAVLFPPTPWPDLLREFMRNVRAGKDDYTWSRANRRHLWRGLYLPGPVGVHMEVVVWVDQSGSITQELLKQFGGELTAILEECNVTKAWIVHHDAEVQHVDEWEKGQDLELKAYGGGGTDHRPCFRWVEEQGVQPDCVVSLTDLYSEFPRHAPAYPILWAVSKQQGWHGDPPKYGQLVELED